MIPTGGNVPSGSAKAATQPGRQSGFEAMMPGSSQILQFSNSSVASLAFGANTTLVRIFSTQDCWLQFGVNPQVTGSSYFLPSGIIDFIGVYGGSQIAALQSSQAGYLTIVEGAQ